MLRIFLTCLGTTILFGLIRDQILAHMCVEFFRLTFPRILKTESPAVLGLVWGVINSGVVGAVLGIVLSLAARAGSWPKVTSGAMVRPIQWLVSVMAVGALAGGMVGYWMARKGKVVLQEPVASQVANEKHHVFFADFFAYNATYFFAILGGSILFFIVLTNRRRAAGMKSASMASRPAQP